MTLKKLNKRLNKEYDELVAQGMQYAQEHDEPEFEYFLKHAYEFAHYNEIIDFFENMEEEDYDDNYNELFDNISPTIRILYGIYQDWLDYAHPEIYNFFAYEDLSGIIQSWLIRHKKQ